MFEKPKSSAKPEVKNFTGTFNESNPPVGFEVAEPVIAANTLEARTARGIPPPTDFSSIAEKTAAEVAPADTLEARTAEIIPFPNMKGPAAEVAPVAPEALPTPPTLEASTVERGATAEASKEEPSIFSKFYARNTQSQGVFADLRRKLEAKGPEAQKALEKSKATIGSGIDKALAYIGSKLATWAFGSEKKSKATLDVAAVSSKNSQEGIATARASTAEARETYLDISANSLNAFDLMRQLLVMKMRTKTSERLSAKMAQLNQEQVAVNRDLIARKILFQQKLTGRITGETVDSVLAEQAAPATVAPEAVPVPTAATAEATPVPATATSEVAPIPVAATEAIPIPHVAAAEAAPQPVSGIDISTIPSFVGPMGNAADILERANQAELESKAMPQAANDNEAPSAERKAA
jgi:hypothetical protein